jgi:thymidylate kinase
MPMIVIEGIDGGGKSTLVSRIKDLIPSNYDKVFWSKGVPQHDNPEDEYMKQLGWLRRHHFVVTDRYHVGELIYGPLYRGYSMTAGKPFAAIEEQLDQLNAVKVILLPDLELCKQRAFERGEDYLKVEDFEYVWNEYKKFVDEHDSWIHITDNSEEVAKQLVERATK